MHTPREHRQSAVAGSFTHGHGDQPGRHVGAIVRYTAKGWGTVLDTQVKNVPAGDRCQLVVTDSSGRSTVVGGW